MKRTSPAETQSSANVLSRAIEHANAAGVQPSWPAMLPTLKPRADGQPKTTTTAIDYEQVLASVTEQSFRSSPGFAFARIQAERG
jgi:hypothetical protein